MACALASLSYQPHLILCGLIPIVPNWPWVCSPPVFPPDKGLGRLKRPSAFAASTPDPSRLLAFTQAGHIVRGKGGKHDMSERAYRAGQTGGCEPRVDRGVVWGRDNQSRRIEAEMMGAATRNSVRCTRPRAFCRCHSIERSFR